MVQKLKFKIFNESMAKTQWNGCTSSHSRPLFPLYASWQFPWQWKGRARNPFLRNETHRV